MRASSIKAWLARLFGRAEPVLAVAQPRDAGALAAIHAASFNRGWSEQEFEQLLTDRNVIADRAGRGKRIAGFIVSRRAADEAEILSVAVARSWRGRGLAKKLLDLHLRRLAGLGLRAIFLEVDEDNAPARRLYARAGFHEVGRRPGYYAQGNASPAAALVLRRDLV
jgi:ribosomal-protein-alanine N-acetyltransferase